MWYRPFSIYSAAIILSRAAVFSRGKEVISFPPFVCVWMWATLFQQYSLDSTPLSILTKIYKVSLAYNSCWSQKNRNFLNWCNSPHQLSAVVSPSFSGFLPFHQLYRLMSVDWFHDEEIDNKIDAKKYLQCWMQGYKNLAGFRSDSSQSVMFKVYAY